MADREYQRKWREKNREKLRKYHREYYGKHKDKYRESRQRATRKYRANLPLEKKQEMCRRYHLNWRTKHPNRYEAQKVNLQEYNRKIKYDVLTYYGGGKCACVKCGESRLACLSIDHIDGGGRAHNRAINRWGGTFYRWLQTEGYPIGYQTLCMNCQWVKKYERNENNRGEAPSPGRYNRH